MLAFVGKRVDAAEERTAGMENGPEEIVWRAAEVLPSAQGDSGPAPRGMEEKMDPAGGGGGRMD